MKTAASVVPRKGPMAADRLEARRHDPWPSISRTARQLLRRAAFGRSSDTRLVARPGRAYAAHREYPRALEAIIRDLIKTR
jgi:hypothetical protein